MSRPWMPLYIADYLADTAHLSAAEHGAYLLLIMHYWQTGGLPLQDDRLARIVRMSLAEWAATKPVIRPFFGEDWRHARIDGERAEAERLANAGRKGGQASAETRKNKRKPRPSQRDDEAERQRSGKQNANDLATISQAPQPQPQKDDEMSARARDPAPLISAEAHALAASFMVAIGFPEPLDWPLEFVGLPHRAQVWIAEGWTEPIIIATAQKIMDGRPAPPGVRYFEKAFANAFASLKSNVPSGQPTEVSRAKTPRRSAITDAIDGHIRRLAEAESCEGGGIREVAPRMLPSG